MKTDTFLTYISKILSIKIPNKRNKIEVVEVCSCLFITQMAMGYAHKSRDR